MIDKIVKLAYDRESQEWFDHLDNCGGCDLHPAVPCSGCAKRHDVDACPYLMID